MASSTIPDCFKFDDVLPDAAKPGDPNEMSDRTIVLKNCRGKIPSVQTSRFRSMVHEARRNPEKIIATVCSDDGLSSRLVEEAGFPYIFLGGFMVASSFGLPDTVCLSFSSLTSIAKLPFISPPGIHRFPSHGISCPRSRPPSHRPRLRRR
jgi:hypothetical protein